MYVFSKLFIFFSLLHLTSSSPPEVDLVGKCGFWTTTKFMVRCRSLIYNSFFYQKPQSPNRQFFNEMNELCEKTKDCFSSFECEEIKKMEKSFEKACELTFLVDSDNELCLKGFFRKAYSSQFSQEDSCFKENSFLSQNMTERRSAYKNGKLCFIKYVRDYCTSSTLDHFNAENYEIFTRSISTKPDDDECKDSYSFLESFQCKSLMLELSSRVKKVDSSDDHTYPPDTLKVCKDTAACVANSCDLRKDLKLELSIEDICFMIQQELQTTPTTPE